MNSDVTFERWRWLGGSDIPSVLGISKFKSRWKLLLEKAQLEEPDFTGNRFTAYGNLLEPAIREHINITYGTTFEPCVITENDLRGNTDGFNGECVLEIKTTSGICASVDGYKAYLVQLLFYMQLYKVEDGILAVYDRPEDMNPVFDAKRLQVFEIRLEEHRKLLEYVNREIDKFRVDLERLKENPLLSEQDFLPAGNLVVLADKVAKFENQLAQLKEIENQCKEAKKQLYNEMLNRNVKSWTMPNGTKLTRVDEVPAGTKKVTEFDTEAFKIENPAIYQRYIREVEKKTNGKSGYVRITVN